MVSCSMVLSPAKDKYCLGYSLRDSGQRRVPDPPERITGIILNNTHPSVNFIIATELLKLY